MHLGFKFATYYLPQFIFDGSIELSTTYFEGLKF
jgi:hypothetical protein